MPDELVFFEQHREMFCCPRCGADLEAVDRGFQCARGDHFETIDGIPALFAENVWDEPKSDVTEVIRAFYEENPFPNYDEFDDLAALIDKARRGVFARLLDAQIPYQARVLECGCGTGQLTNFLSVASRTVIGTDLSLSSLRLATQFKNRHNVERAHFYQMNLFRPCFKPRSFDMVISLGVLHHTSDPFLAFRSIAALVRPGGYILIGLYHRFGRLLTDLRRSLFRISKDRLRFLDRRSVDERISRAKRDAWFMDQYKNPHESKHTVSEVLDWLGKTGFEFVHSIPKTVPFARLTESERLFVPDRPGNWWQRAMVDAGMIVSGHREGGFFVVIARNAGTQSVS